MFGDEEFGTHPCVVRSWVMFCYIVSDVVFVAGRPIDEELVLMDLVANPMKSHVNCFGPFVFHGFIYKSNCGGVVDLHWGEGLGVANFFKCNLDWHGFFCCKVCCRDFGFHCGTHDIVDDFFQCVYDTIHGW